MWTLNNSLLQHKWAQEKNHMEIFKYMDNNEKTTLQNL